MSGDERDRALDRAITLPPLTTLTAPSGPPRMVNSLDYQGASFLARSTSHAPVSPVDIARQPLRTTRTLPPLSDLLGHRSPSSSSSTGLQRPWELADLGQDEVSSSGGQFPTPYDNRVRSPFATDHGRYRRGSDHSSSGNDTRSHMNQRPMIASRSSTRSHSYGSNSQDSGLGNDTSYDESYQPHAEGSRLAFGSLRRGPNDVLRTDIRSFEYPSRYNHDYDQSDRGGDGPSHYDRPSEFFQHTAHASTPHNSIASPIWYGGAPHPAVRRFSSAENASKSSSAFSHESSPHVMPYGPPRAIAQPPQQALPQYLSHSPRSYQASLLSDQFEQASLTEQRPDLPPAAIRGDAAPSGSTNDGRPLLLHVMPGLTPTANGRITTRYEGTVHVDGRLLHQYEGGACLPTAVDGYGDVNPEHGLTKAGQPRKRSSGACERCRKKKVRCVAGFDGCTECVKAGKVCQ